MPYQPSPCRAIAVPCRPAAVLQPSCCLKTSVSSLAYPIVTHPIVSAVFSCCRHHATFPKRWTLHQLQHHVGDILKIEPRKLRMYDSYSEVRQIPYRRRSRLWMRTSNAQVTVPIYLWKGSEDTIAFLFNMNIEETWLVTELKKELAKKLKSDCAMDMDHNFMRVREIGVNIFRDEQSVLDAVIKFAGDEKLAVNALEYPEPKVLPSHKVVTCIQWNPEDYATGRQLEVVVTDRAQCNEFRQQLSELVQVPAEHIGTARHRALYGIHTPLDIPGLSWDTDRGPSNVDALGYTHHPETTLAYPKDGDIYYFRDNRVTLKEVTAAERTAMVKAQQAAISAKGIARRPEPKGVTINVASPQVADTPTASVQAAAAKSTAASAELEDAAPLFAKYTSVEDQDTGPGASGDHVPSTATVVDYPVEGDAALTQMSLLRMGYEKTRVDTAVMQARGNISVALDFLTLESIPSEDGRDWANSLD